MSDETTADGDVALDALSGSGPRITSSALPRRTILRAAGVAVALPWLEAMAGAMPAGSPRGAATSARPPRRLLYIYVPNGVKVDEWRTEVPMVGEGRRARPAPGARTFTELAPLLQPLEPYRSQLQVLRGLTHDKARANGDGPGDHARAAAVYLTGVQPLKTEGRVRIGISADQLAARTIGGATRLRSLVLGLEGGRQSGQCDSGYSCAYSGHVSWESATVPAAKEVDPRLAFDRLFRGGDAALSEEARKTRLSARRSVLDFVRGESGRLAKRLGAEDRARMDEYETGLFELERQLRFDSAAREDRASDADRPAGVPASFAEHARLLGQVLALGFATDVTRIATLMYGNEGSSRRYVEVDVSDGHHPLSHHGGDPEKLAAIGRINRLHLASFVELLDALAARKEAGGTVLDSTIVTYGSGIAEGNRHDHHDLPVLLVGGKRTGLGGSQAKGRSVALDPETPMNDLHLALLQRVGVPDDVLAPGLGDSRGILDGI